MGFRSNLLVYLIILAGIALSFSLFKGITLLGSDPRILHDIIFSLRLPRTLAAFVTGGLLALAGGLMQILLRNPLADPYVLGSSGGAAVATLLLLLAGFSGLTLIGGAWIGSLIAITLVWWLAQSQQGFQSYRVLLTGIALGSGFSALISFLLLTSPDNELRSMLFWLMGDLSYAHYPWVESLILLFGLGWVSVRGRELTILLRGPQEAKSLGVNSERLNLSLFLLSAALTAAAVTLAGCIGFIGLIIPHLLRLLGLHDQRT